MNTSTTLSDAQIAAIAQAVTLAVVAALHTGSEPASQVTQSAPDAPTTYQARSKSAKAKVHAEIRKINVRYDMKLAGGSRKVSDLPAAERKAYDAEVAAAWKAAPRTVTVTKA